MTQEEKQLWLKDLSARLPYGVKILDDTFKKYGASELINIGIDGSMLVDNKTNDIQYYPIIDNIKPYLRPMDSMTEEEKEDLKKEHLKDEKLYAECLTNAANGDSSMRGKVIPHFAADWCNKNHFDYRGFIEKGLAIEAPEDMYKNE